MSLPCRSMLLGVMLLTGAMGVPTTVQAVRSSTLSSHTASQATHAREFYTNLPLRFEVNQGQTDPQVKFLSRGSGYTLFLTSTDAVVAFSRAAVRMQLIGANRGPRVEALDRLPGSSHYFVGNNPGQWHANVPAYARVKYHEVYPGIDLVYYGKQSRMEYDFVVAPGADAGVIRFDVGGAEKLELDASGNLLAHAGGGQLELKKPVAYQMVDGLKKEISSEYLVEDSQVRLRLAPYDRSRPLVIDPVLLYSTFLGGNGVDAAMGIAVDGSGNAYVTGVTGSTNFPTTVGSFQSGFGGGVLDFFGIPTDTFVTKINSTGSAVVYSTYLGGGTGGELGTSIAVDVLGNAYLTGTTSSSDFPILGGSQATFGGNYDAFITKLSASGSGLVYSTYLGGGCEDVAWGIALDPSRNAYVVGSTKIPGPSPENVPCVHDVQDFPTTEGAFQEDPPGHQGEDVFVSKLSADGSAVVYSTFLGGDGDAVAPDDQGRAIAVDAAGNAYVTGSTNTTDFPHTAGAYQTTFGGDTAKCTHQGGAACDDAFITKINSSGTALVYSTYLGLAYNEGGNGIAIDSAGNAYVVGFAEHDFHGTGSEFHGTPGAYQTTINGGGTNALIVKLNPSGSALVYATFLDGGTPPSGVPTGGGTGTGIAVDATGNAYVTGHTRSTNFPTTSDAVQISFADGSAGNGDNFFCENGHCDAFAAKIDQAGSHLLYSTYLGGSGDDTSSGIALGPGAFYVTGLTSSLDFPTTAVAFQPNPPTKGNGVPALSGFIVKIGPPNCETGIASVGEIWPANHKMVTVGIVGATDPDGQPVTITITGIQQDEPTNGLGDGDTPVDGSGVGTSRAQVRAERAGTGDGRVYLIQFVATNTGFSCSGSVLVGVPHDQRLGHQTIDSGVRYDSTVAGGAPLP